MTGPITTSHPAGAGRTTTRRRPATKRRPAARRRPPTRRRPAVAGSRKRKKGRRTKGWDVKRGGPGSWWRGRPGRAGLGQRRGDGHATAGQCTLAGLAGHGHAGAGGERARSSPRSAASRGLPDRAVVIALATAQQESRLRNLDYGDRDSLGLFQQRPSSGWGTAAQVQDPEYAAGKFFDRLVRVPGWETGRLTEVARPCSAAPSRRPTSSGARGRLAAARSPRWPTGSSVRPARRMPTRHERRHCARRRVTALTAHAGKAARSTPTGGERHRSPHAVHPGRRQAERDDRPSPRPGRSRRGRQRPRRDDGYRRRRKRRGQHEWVKRRARTRLGSASHPAAPSRLPDRRRSTRR